MILITGASGLVGSNLLYKLTCEGETVKALIRSEKSKEMIYFLFSLYTDDPDILMDKIHWVYGDIRDLSSLYEAFADVNKVFHCAGLVSFDKSDNPKMYETHVSGTANIVNLCLEAGVEKLVHVSSIAALKSNDEGKLINEADGWPTVKNISYSACKILSEREVWRGIEEGLCAVIVNPSVILGAGNWKKGSPEIFYKIYNGLKYYTLGKTGYVDVSDVANCMIKLMNSNLHSERFILNAVNLTYQELFEKIASNLMVKLPKKYASPFMTELAWRLDKIRSLLTFSKSRFTRQIARTSHRSNSYSSDKICEALDFKFRSIDESINEICSLFLKSMEY